jgi:hypothetical protein
MTTRRTQEFRELGRARSHRSGSRRRPQKIRLRGNWSPEAVLCLIALLLILTVLVPWLVRHPLGHPYVPERPAFSRP